MKSTVATLAQSPFGNFRVSNYKPRSVDLNAKGPGFVSFGTNFGFSTKKFQTLVSKAKTGSKRIGLGSRSFAVVRASISPESGGSEEPIAPLQFESPIGQFLSQILVSHPHLVPAAVEKQLEQLQTDRDLEKNEDTSSSSSAGTDLVLYRRIAELKANERKKALEEILYTLVVQKFMDANVSLVPSIAPSSSDPSGRVDSWPSQDETLKQLHSPEAYEMIQNHLSLILGNRITDSTSVAQISKLRVGQVYAASVMYGYFLKRVDQRFQLEKSMKVLPNSLIGDENEEDESIDGVREILGQDTRPVGGPSSHPEVSSWGAGGVSAAGFGNGMRTSRLRTYVMSFDGETLQRYATIRSKEAVSIIEKHTEALFGRPEIVITPEGTINSSKDEVIKISFGGLKRLILEAVTFGSFLWDVESYVDARYHFMLS